MNNLLTIFKWPMYMIYTRINWKELKNCMLKVHCISNGL